MNKENNPKIGENKTEAMNHLTAISKVKIIKFMIY